MPYEIRKKLFQQGARLSPRTTTDVGLLLLIRNYVLENPIVEVLLFIIVEVLLFIIIIIHRNDCQWVQRDVCVDRILTISVLKITRIVFVLTCIEITTSDLRAIEI